MFSWFHTKKKNVYAALFEGMTDVHTHLLPGVDDGSQHTADSVEILRFMRELGVKRVYLTPHVMADLPENTPEALRIAYEAFLPDCPPGLELQLAAEYMLDAGFASLMEKGLLTMSARHVLVETSYLAPPLGMKDILYDLSLAGYQPVIAHPERYRYMRESDYHKWKDRGCKLQLNLFSLSGSYGLAAERNACYLLKQGLYDYFGSDVHQPDDYRKSLTHLSPSRSQLKELERLAANNQTLW